MAIKTQPQLNAEIQTSFPDNVIGQITPSITRGMLQDLSDTLFASSSSLSAANIALALSASTPLAPQINLFNSTDVSTASFFGAAYTLEVISNRAGIIAQTINNFSNTNFPPAMNATGWLRAGAEGGQVFGYFGRAVAEVAGGASHELDAFNNSSQDAPLTIPRGDSFGTTSTWTTALCLASGSSTGKNNWAGLYLVKEPTTPGTALFNYGIVFNANAVKNTGIYMDAGAATGPVTSIFLRNNGQSTNVHLDLQTMGNQVTTNPVLRHTPQLTSGGSAWAGTVSWEVTQQGSFLSNLNSTITSLTTLNGINFYGIGLDGNNAASVLETYSGSGVFNSQLAFRTARGTGLSPTNVATGDTIGGLSAKAFCNSTFTGQNGGTIMFVYTDPTPATWNGTAIAFSTTPNGTFTRAEALRVLDAGNLKFTNASNFTANGAKAIVFTASSGPTAAVGTAIAKWLTFQDSSGTVSYIPVWQ